MTAVDRIKERADAREWEKQNRQDDARQGAVSLMYKAVLAIWHAEEALQEAADAMADSPERFRIASLVDNAEDLETWVRMQIGRM